MPAELDQLIAVRSQLALELLEYFRLVIAAPDSRDNIPAYLGDRTPTALYIEPDVLKRKRKEEKEWERGRAEEQGRGSEKERRDGRTEDREARREIISPEAQDVGERALYGERGHEIDRRVAWTQELKEIERVPSRRAVILAPPGQGKSLLTQMTARSLAEQASKDLYDRRAEINAIPLPVVASLNTLTDKVIIPGTRPDEALRRAITAALRENLACYPEIAVNYLVDHFHESRCWLFLDALDEASDENALALIFNVLKQWQCRVVITSRPYGYERRRLPFDVTEYRLAPLTDAQARSFVEKWYSGGGRQTRMIELLTRSHSIRRMSQSPFLLMLLCWVAERYDQAEDITRTQLYDRIVLDLLGLPPNGKGEVDDLRANELLPLITEVAFASFQENAGRDPMPSKHLLAVMAASPRRPAPLGLKANDIVKLNPSERAGYLLDELREKRLLAPLTRKRDAYVFPHRSILEYLAACSLAELVNDPKGRRWKTEITTTGNKWQVREFVDKKAWRSEYQETICFLAGKLNDPAPLLEMLSTPKPTRTNPTGDDWLRHRLAIAAQCLPEVHRPTDPMVSGLIAEITTQTFSLWFECQIRGSEEDLLHLTHVLPALVQSRGRVLKRSANSQLKKRVQDITKKGENGPELLDIIGELLRCSERYSMQRAAANAVAGIGGVAATQRFLDHLAELLRDSDFDVRQAAAEAVAGIGSAAATPQILDCLAELLRDDGPGVCQAAAEAIGSIGAAAATPQILNCLAELLGVNVWEVQGAAVRAVGCIGAAAATRQILGGLAGLFSYGDYKYMRRAAAEALDGIGAAAAMHLITDRLASWKLPGHLDKWFNCYLYLWSKSVPTMDDDIERGPTKMQILNNLQRLLSHYDEDVRRAAAEAVCSVGAAAATPQILDRLVDLLWDRNDDVQYAAAEALSRIGAITPQILSRLAKLLLNSDEEDKLRAAANVVGGIGAAAATPQILGYLTRLLRDHCWYVRSAAARAVGRIGAAAATPQIINCLTELLRDCDGGYLKGDYEDVQSAAVGAFGEIGAAAAMPQILDCLAELLRDDDWSVRSAAAIAIGSIGPDAAKPLILDRLAELLRDWDMRTVAVEVMAHLIGDDVRIFRAKGIRSFVAKNIELQINKFTGTIVFPQKYDGFCKRNFLKLNKFEARSVKELSE